MRLLQVVPRLPPPADGVGDYALALARALAAAGLRTSFLVPASSGRAAAGAEFRLSSWRENTAGAFTEALDRELAERSEGDGPCAVLVHYAGYGYADRGCPGWLVRGLRRWRAQGGGLRLATLFHEVHASGPPWRSSFWLSPVQRHLAGDLARASDRVITNLELYRDLLARWVPAAAIAVLPVFSTVGELASPARLAARRRRLVVFGGPGGRVRAYGEHAAALAAACAALEIEEIVDVGTALSGPSPDALAGVPVTRLGALAADAVSALLAGSLAGFVSHAPAFLGKSTIFAAYCSHGVLPVAACRERGEGRLWTPGTEAGGTSGTALQATADAAFAWYAGHSLARQVETFRALLGAEGA